MPSLSSVLSISLFFISPLLALPTPNPWSITDLLPSTTSSNTDTFDDWPKTLPFNTGILDEPHDARLNFTEGGASGTTKLSWQATSMLVGLKNQVLYYGSDGVQGPTTVNEHHDDGNLGFTCENREGNGGLSWKKELLGHVIDTLEQEMGENGFREFEFEVWQSKSVKVGVCVLGIGDISNGLLHGIQPVQTS